MVFTNRYGEEERWPDHHPLVSAVGTYTPLADSDTFVKAQQDDSQLADLKYHIEQGTLPQHCPRCFRKCFIKNGLLCREYKDSTTQMTYIQAVVPPSLRSVVLQEVHNNLGHLELRKLLIKSRPGFTGPVTNMM